MLITIAFIIFTPPLSDAVSVQVDGKIDLGPKWSYEFNNLRTTTNSASKLQRKHLVKIPDIVSKMLEKYSENKEPKEDTVINNTSKGNSSKTKIHRKERKDRKDRQVKIEKHKTVTKDENFKRVTQYEEAQHNDMYVKPHKVKHNAQITNFTVHLYKQAVKMFNAIKETSDNERIKKEVDFLVRSYQEKFGDFVKQTQHQQIKTRLGQQKVLINTMDTSNQIIKRLMNYLMTKMGKSGLRSDHVIQNEINKKMEIERDHICKKFGICRTQEGFSAFVIDILTIILTSNDSKMKSLSDALTEAVKNADFSNIMNTNTEKHFQKGISDIESYEVSLLKPIFYILKNVVVNKNKPIEVVGAVDKRVNKTVGFLEMLDAFEKALPPNEKNLLEWNDLKVSLQDWKDDKRTDITEIMQTFVDHLKRGVDKFDKKTAINFERNINLILGTL